MGPWISKESGSNFLQTEKEKLLLAPYSDGEDSEIEIERNSNKKGPISKGPVSTQQQLSEIDKQKDILANRNSDKFGPRKHHCLD